jgi:restriction system protein
MSGKEPHPLSDHIPAAHSALPKYFHYIKPVLEVQKNLGGSSKAVEVRDRVVDKLFVSGRFLSVPLNPRLSAIQADLQKVRRILVNAGFMRSVQKGVWELTEKGLTIALSDKDLINLNEVRKGIDKKYREKRKQKTKSDVLQRTENKRYAKSINTDNDHRIDPFNQLQSLSTEESARICKKILSKSGFAKTNITAISRGRYIEGECIFEKNPFHWLKVLFRLDRHKYSIDSKAVRGFRTAMRGRADKGILMTTNTFTMNAKWEASREGVLPIMLIDRYKLIELINKL